METMNDFLNDIDASFERIKRGDLVKGTIVSVTENEVFINIGRSNEAVITKNNFSLGECSLKDIAKIGDEVSAEVITTRNEDGNIELSKVELERKEALNKARAERKEAWNAVQKLYDNNETITVKVIEVVKGGVRVNVNGLVGFVPGSQISTSRIEDLSTLKDSTLKARIIEFEKDKKLVLSSKVLQVEASENAKKAVWKTFEVGQKRTGKVVRLAKFGAFVDFDGVTGLIHLNELSWKRVHKPEDVVSVGDEVEVFVLDFNEKENKLSLSLKDVLDNPWNKATSLFTVGKIYEGKVSKLLDFGAVVNLHDGIDGLVHLSEISEENITKPSSVLNIGDKVKVKVLNIDTDKNRISLSIKDALNNFNEDLAKYNDDTSSTIGDLFAEKLKGLKF